LTILADEFQETCNETAIYPRDQGVVYTLLGLSNEAGELLGKYKKFLRDSSDWSDVREAMIGELGDVLWYCAQLSTELDVELSTVMERVLHKLQDRKARGVIGGSGDNR